jgi:hypothetical protein
MQSRTQAESWPSAVAREPAGSGEAKRRSSAPSRPRATVAPRAATTRHRGPSGRAATSQEVARSAGTSSMLRGSARQSNASCVCKTKRRERDTYKPQWPRSVAQRTTREASAAAAVADGAFRPRGAAQQAQTPSLRRLPAPQRRPRLQHPPPPAAPRRARSPRPVALPARQPRGAACATAHPALLLSALPRLSNTRDVAQRRLKP